MHAPDITSAKLVCKASKVVLGLRKQYSLPIILRRLHTLRVADKYPRSDGFSRIEPHQGVPILDHTVGFDTNCHGGQNCNIAHVYLRPDQISHAGRAVSVISIQLISVSSSV
jgi:hypothetical protein